MIPFFRKIRRKFADNNQFLKYSRYAVGEIVLVVIGILIALQINTWNGERKVKLKEKVILQSLLDEFKTNSASLLIAKKKATINKNNCREILKHISNDQLELSKNTSDTLIMWSLFGGVVFHVSDRYINSILSTGEIHILQNDSLKHLITNWSVVVIDNSVEAETWMQQGHHLIITPFLNKHYSLATEYFKSNNLYNSPFKFDYRQIYGNPEFENIVIQKVTTYSILLGAYDELDKYINKIISITEKELQLE